ncbi:hypothetical protein C0989_006729 [Termitomyces sp. Mn162]|nr:hypothetical protein C0989_006729 [Termitomyces sp. Mn162]
MSILTTQERMCTQRIVLHTLYSKDSVEAADHNIMQELELQHLQEVGRNIQHSMTDTRFDITPFSPYFHPTSTSIESSGNDSQAADQVSTEVHSPPPPYDVDFGKDERLQHFMENTS